MNTYPTSNDEARVAHAAMDAAEQYDIEDEARRNPFLAAHVARCDAAREKENRIMDRMF